MLWCVLQTAHGGVVPIRQAFFLQPLKSKQHLLLLFCMSVAFNRKAANAQDELLFFLTAEPRIDRRIHDLTINAPKLLCPAAREIGNSSLDLVTFHASRPRPTLIDIPSGM